MAHAQLRRVFFHVLSLLALLVSLASTASAPAVSAATTPAPSSVTIAGSLQSELGCAGDWDPACAATHLTYDAGDDVWQGTLDRPGRQL